MSELMLKTFTPNELKDFKKGQEIMTNMLRELDRICRKYNIRYWCVGGTFIGAIRHKGWIPWDGDIDVAIFQEDYSKLKEVIQNELPKGFWYQDKTIDPFYTTHFGKIRCLYSFYKDENKKNHNGLQLDLFVFRKTINNRIIGEYEHYGLKGPNESYHYNDIFPLKETMFEDIKVFIPNKFEDKCRKIFGGYPIPLPPENKRYPHEGKISFDIPEWIKNKYKHLYI